ncbi:hypothetical protein [Falsiroseomonas sp. CW058]|uniref:hypothetical protein n=1 Tax=Falsiroseomonas sp. CW058 TaxID=3388664 RepID=UPI003D31AF34
MSGPVRYRRHLSPIVFKDGMAQGWVFGVPDAFKACLDIATEGRILSPRSILLRELRRLKIECHQAAIDGDRSQLHDLYDAMKRAGLPVLGWAMTRDAVGKPRGEFLLELQGVPASIEFAEGDIFFEPAEVRRMPWHDALPLLRRSVQIKDYFVGRATIDVMDYSAGEIVKRTVLECSGQELVQLLWHGTLPIVNADMSLCQEAEN